MVEMKRMIIYGWLLGSIWVMVACTSELSPLEEAMQSSGSNRLELEKVLEYYRNDSLKLKAAEFLIENMPFHYAYSGKDLEKYHHYFEYFPQSWRGPTFVRDSLVNAEGAFCLDSLVVVPDIRVVKSDYLIRNIDFAFKVWHGQPWGKNVSFNDFLEYILPYRVGTEEIAEWREELYERYNPLLDSIRSTSDSANIIAVAQVLMDSLSVAPVHFTGVFPQGPTVGPKLVEWRSGNCRELTDLVTYVFRAVGIPCGCDKMLMRGDKNVAHYWNFVVDETDTTYFASIGHQSKKFERADTYWDPKGKVWRETYSLNRDLTNDVGHDMLSVPKVFREPLMQDVTMAYAGKINWLLRIGADSLVFRPRSGETVYLCMASRDVWMPIGYGSFKDDTVRIDNVQGAVVFRLAVCRNGNLVSLGLPFLLDKYTGNVHFFREDGKKQRTVIFQKFKEDFQTHMLGGVFEADNDPGFRHPDTLYIISERPPRLMNRVALPQVKSYRYVRYYGPETRHCNIAELSFHAEPGDTSILCGTVIFPSGAEAGFYANQFNNVFDGDPYTSMNYCDPSGGWVGLDFGCQKAIGELVYTPRNRDNFIHKGDCYELFYASEKGWESLGKQVADADSLVYEVPCGVLLYIRNHTRGVDDRIFEMQDGRQKLW